MARKIIINNKETQLKYKQELSIQPSDELSHSALIERAGGSISNLPVKTKEFADWIDERRISNPLIGRDYITGAPEYNSEQFKLGDETQVVGQDAIDLINAEENKAFDVDASQSVLSDNLGDSINGTDNHDKNFIDMVIIENTTQQLLTSDADTISTTAIDAIKKYHGDVEYQTNINVTDVIEQTQILMIEQKNHTKLLK